MPLPSKFTFEAIGTWWSIETVEAIKDTVRHQIEQLCERYDATYSRFRDDSLITRISRRAGTYDFPEDSQELFDLYDKLYTSTSGKVTPLIGRTLDDLGYDAKYSLKPADSISPAGKWDEIVQRDHTALTVSEPVLIDVGAAGKGYLVDLIAGVLKSNDIHEYIIDASGDIVHRTLTSETIGLEDPREPGKVIGAVELHDASLCANASNRRAWRDVHHIVDPETAEPVRDIIATGVIATDGLTADGLATALFFVPPEQLSDFTFGYVVMYADGSVHHDARSGWKLYR